MSAIVKPEHIYNLITKHKTIFWTIKTTDRGLKYGENQDEITPDESVELLKECLSHIAAKTVLIELRPKPIKKTAGTAETAVRGGDIRTGFFNCIVDISSNLPPQERNQGMYGGAAFEEILKSKEQIHQLQMAAALKEKEAEINNPNPLYKIIEKFVENESLIGVISDKLISALTLPRATPIAGRNNQIDETLNRLKTLDKDYETTLFNLANYLEANPGIIDSVKSMIKP